MSFPTDRPLSTVAALVKAGFAPASGQAELDLVADEFRIRMTPAMQAAVARDADGAPVAQDPVAAQFVPDPRELLPFYEEMEFGRLADELRKKKQPERVPDQNLTFDFGV